MRGQIVFFLLSFAPFVGAYSQTQATDTAFLASAIQNTRDLYVRSLGVSSHLLNGIRYKEYNPHAEDEGMPFFVTDDWVDGSVYYDGSVYTRVGILYDLVQDKVVIEHPYGGIKLELISEKVNHFSMQGHVFVRIDEDTIKNSPIRTGFYDLLYDGRTKFYVKRQKVKRDHIIGREIQVEFTANDRFYIYKKGQYLPVKRKASVLSIFEARKSELRKYLRKNKIRFRNNPELAITRVVSFYDESGK